MSDHALRGRAGLGTGASSGIGRAIALTLATEGVALALVGRDKARLVDIAQEARAAGAPMVTPLLVDLADEVRVRAAAAIVAHMVDKLDPWSIPLALMSVEPSQRHPLRRSAASITRIYVGRICRHNSYCRD